MEDASRQADPNGAEKACPLKDEHDQHGQGCPCRAVNHGKAAAEKDAGQKDPGDGHDDCCLPAHGVKQDHGHDVGQTDLDPRYAGIEGYEPLNVARHQGQGQKKSVKCHFFCLHLSLPSA